MRTDQWQLIQTLFEKAIDLPFEQIDGLLGDHKPEVRDEVIALILADKKATLKSAEIHGDISHLSHEIASPSIPGYDIVELIAQGGMGSVYLAWDDQLSRQVAIKILHPHLSQQQKFKQRFLREARAAARLQHVNINTIYEIGENESGLVYIASAYCPGLNLAQRIRQTDLTLHRIIDISRQLASALVTAHQLGIVHRDLKPENIIVNDDFQIKLVDFGIAKIRDEHQTSTGEIIGTPAYMSPEQFRGEGIDHLTDIWSNGMILYEMLEGHSPFEGLSTPEIVYSLLHEPIPFSSDRQKKYPALYSLIQQCLNIDKSLRPGNAETLQQQLLKAQAELKPSAHYDDPIAYERNNPDSDKLSQPSLTTKKNVLLLQLPGARVDEQLTQLARKFRGTIIPQSAPEKTDEDGINIVFGYPLADELTIKNGLLFGLSWIEQANEGEARKALAHYQEIKGSGSENRQTLPSVDLGESGTIAWISSQTNSGLWITPSLSDTLPLGFRTTSRISEGEEDAECIAIEADFSQQQLQSLPLQLSPFTGRESQLMVLNECWQQAVEGESQRVLISGEAGIGKSRLIHEFKKETHRHSGLHLVELFCSPYEQASSYFPILNYLKQEISSSIHLGSGLNRDSIDRLVTPLLDLETVEHLLLYQLLGLTLDEKEFLQLPTGDLLNRRYQSLLGQLLIASPADKTTLIIIEDLHWIDQATSLIVEQLLQPSSAHQCLVVLSCRPEYKPQWLINVVTSNLYLSKLRQTQTKQLLSNLLQESHHHKSESEITQLADRTGGNPLFVEELVKSLLRQTKDSEAVPESIEGALVSRLDRLGPARDLAQIAAVIGRHFNRKLLLNCTGQTKHEFDQYFDTLVKAEIFYPTEDPQQWYFKHALIRDAAYQTLEEGSKKQLHRSIAETIEDFDNDLAEAQPSLLAQHWEFSGNIPLAIDYWLKSAQRNLILFSISNCIDQCNHALELCSTLSSGKEEFELALYATLGPALMNRFGYADEKAGEAYNKALNLTRISAGEDTHINIMFGNWTYFCVRAEHQKAFELAQHMTRISEAAGIRHEICESWMAQGINDFYRGEFIAARSSLQKAIDHYDADESSHHIATYGQDPFVASTNFQAWNELVLGNLPQSLANAEAAIQRARQTEHPMTLAYALSFATYVYMTIGEFETAEKLVNESIQICTDNDIILFLGLSLVLQALLHFNRNEVELGEQAMTRATDVYLPSGAQVMIPNFLIIQAEVLVKAGRIEEAEGLTDQALEIISQTGENWCLGPALANKAMINLLNQKQRESGEILTRLVQTLAHQQAEGIKQLLLQKGLPLETASSA